MKILLATLLKTVPQPTLRLPRILGLALLALLLAPSAWAATTVTYTAAGSYWWTCPPGVTSVQVECWGGGGGGGGTVTATACAAGGGAGGNYVLYSVSVTPGTTYNLTVGAGGAGGLSSSGGPGGSGVDSYFGNTTAGNSSGATVLAPGGNGGNGATVAGYTATGGAVKSTGAVPASGATVTYASAGANATTSPANSSGAGSTGAGSGGAGGAARTTENNGNSGTAPGGGGSGSFSVTLAKTGGVGAAGQVKLTFAGTQVTYNLTAGTFSWTAPFSGTAVVECWGGGGAGGGSTKPTGGNNASGSSGGGGAYAKATFSVTANAQYSGVVGAGGAGVSAADGNPGGSSYFSNNVTTTVLVLAAGGGLGKVGNNAQPTQFGAGGTSANSIGDVKNSGGDGIIPANNTTGAGGGGSGGVGNVTDGNKGNAGGNTGTGATAVTGGGNGGAGFASTGSGDGSAPTVFPGGGGGSSRISSVTSKTGGAGSAGYVVITIYAVPTVTSATQAAVTDTSATLGATVTANNGAVVDDYGIVLSSSTATPTVSNTKIQKGTTESINIAYTVASGTLSAGTRYSYGGYAHNAAGYAYSSYDSFYTLSTEPTAHVTGFGASAVSSSQINLSWTASGSAGGYLILRTNNAAAPAGAPSDARGYSFGNTIGSGTVVAVITSGATTSFSDTGLSPSSTYSYAIFPYNWDGSQAATYNYYTAATVPTASATTPSAATPPGAPTANAASSTNSSGFTASWSAGTGSTASYTVDVATDSGFVSFVSGWNGNNVGNVTSANVTGLSAGTTYYYRIYANNGAGTSGASGTITVVTVLAAPVASAATSTNTSGFTAAWAASSGATKYYLDVATDSGFSSILGGYNNLDVGNVTSSSVTGLSLGTTYYYRVAGVCHRGSAVASVAGHFQ